ncbi:MAG: major capsid protein [Nitrospirae bacterium]|nr:major capsid protein [Nitrospirota bacterium]MCL5237415.1 major capsid protein [Nitrospirota bacterium]
MGRLEDLRVVDPVLTTLARGYTNAEMVATLLFLVVLVEKEAGKIPQFGKEAFKIYNTERAIRAKSNRISPEGRTTIDFVMDEHDLEYPIDYREKNEDIFNLEEHATNVVTGGISLRLEKKAADLAQDTNNFPAGNKITLAGNSQFTDKVNSDPIGVIETGKDAVRGKIGKRPNTMLMGAATYKALKQHPQLIDRIKYAMKGIVTIELMKEIFDIERIAVGEAVYADDAGTFNDIWGDNIVLAYVPNTPAEKRTVYEPSFAYTLRKRGKPEIDKRDESGKLEIVRNTDILLPKIVGSEAGYLIKDTNV